MQASEAKAVKAVKGLKETGLPAGYKTQSMDTTIDAERYLFHQWKSLTLIQKANQLVSWTKGCLELSLMGVKQRYPEASLSKLRYEFARVTLKSSFPDPIYHLIAEHSQRLMLIDPISLALDVVEVLNALDIPYLIGGSVASTLMGEMRSTEDVDIVADLKIEKVVRLLQFLQPRFYVSEDAVREAIQFQRSFNLIDNESFGKVLGVLKLQGDRLDFEYLQKWAMELELRDLLATACVESGLEVIQNRSTTANTPRE